MTLADSGPLVAFVDVKDPYHLTAVRAFGAYSRFGIVTTWPCLTEAMHLLGQSQGHPGQAALWRLVLAGVVRLHTPGPAEPRRMAVLMARYRNAPMDLADASLVAAAEVLGLRTVLTFDADFLVYQVADGSFLAVVS